MPSHQEQKDRARKEAEHHATHSMVDRMIESIKDTANERANMETGTYYIKGKPGHSDVEGRLPDNKSFGRTYDSDPKLGKSISSYKD